MRVGSQNKTTDPRFCGTPALSHYLCWFAAPCFQGIKGQPIVITVDCCLPSVDIISSCPDTITLLTVAKTLVTANPGCFPWTSQAYNCCPNRKCPSDSPPSERSWVCDSPLFSSLQQQLRKSVLQWVPKTRVSAPPPPQAHHLALSGRSKIESL